MSVADFFVKGLPSPDKNVPAVVAPPPVEDTTGGLVVVLWRCPLFLIIELKVPQFLNLRQKMAKSIVYVITLITNRNHAFHCLN